MTVPDQPWVIVVDDDSAVRSALLNLLGAAGFRVAALPSGDALLGDPRLRSPSCLVLDVRMPGLSGLDLQKRLAHDEVDVPIVFLTAHGDVPDSVEAMKHGAVDFLQKPVDPAALIEAIRVALTRGADARERRRRVLQIRARLDRLSARERNVLDRVVRGWMNRQIAEDLAITERTVKFHRTNLMDKMGAGSVAELARMVESARSWADSPSAD
jgi:FixJ family two-component response regulator